MKVKDLTIQDWQKLIYKYEASGECEKPNTPCAVRIENTILSTARYFGGMTYNGEQYTYFEPRDPNQPNNPDGTPYVAWLMVRMDFMRWVTNYLKKGGAV